MKKTIFSILIVFLIFFTSIIKNSTKDIDVKIFNINEDIRLLKEKYELVLLDHNYLSSPKKLNEYQKKYFENDLIPIDIEDISEINFNGKIENNSKYIDSKFFKESNFTKLRVSHLEDIIESRINEMMNYLFNKNLNLNYFKNKFSHIHFVFENKIFKENLFQIFKKHLKFNSEKTALRAITLDDLSLLGAAELTFKGWHAEAIPYVQEKKSIFAGVFSRIFK